ncbi:MAG: DUF4258 domain-containing protein [Chloroflexi bacterium]|nr:DUF4258 domain-containing protein [Chloroflexota bacterium]
MQSNDIVLSSHARMQMQRRGITLEDVTLTSQFGEHVTGEEDGTMEACIELDGKPITVVYRSIEHQVSGLVFFITALRRRCREP